MTKTLLSLLICLMIGCGEAQAQTDAAKLWTNGWTLNNTTTGDIDSLTAGSSITIAPQSVWHPSAILFFGKEVKNQYMRIDSAGNLFYRPSAFCKCDTGNSMRFLLNIFKPEKQQSK